MTNKIVLSIISLFLLTSTQAVYSAFPDENFASLEKVKIGDQISTDMLSLGEKTTGTEKDIYTFESERYSHPHVVYISQSKVSFIQLTIPTDSREMYKNMFQSLGSPEERLPKTKSEILIGFPSKGLAFILNGYSGNIERVQKFPVKTADQFRQQEGKNFEPIELNSLLPGAQRPESPAERTPIVERQGFIDKIPSWVLFVVILLSGIGSASCLLLLFSTLRAKRNQN